MGWIITLIIGGIVGWLASILMRVNGQMGIIFNVIVGIVGSYAGQYLVRAAGWSVHGQVAWWIVAIGGAALLIAVLRMFGVFGRLSPLRR